MKSFTIGSDVEFFVKKGKKFVAAIPFIGDEINGGKHNPIVNPDGSTLQRDNVAAEFATSVAGDEKGFVLAMKQALRNLTNLMDTFKLQVVATPSVMFTPDQLVHWEAHEFGCDPDFNAWLDGKPNMKPCAEGTTLRTAALHVHVGSPDLKKKGSKLRMIRMMDCLHGIIGTMVDDSPESLRRKELYGKAGAYRPTAYGVEYRVLSNFFASAPVFVRMLYNLTRDAIAIVSNERDDRLIRMLGGRDEINGVINSGNSSLARGMFHKYLVDYLSVDSRNLVMDAVAYKPRSLKEEWK